MGVKAIETEAAYRQVLAENQGKLIVIDFFATWCGPCRMIAPKMEEFSNTYGDVVFIKVDVDQLAGIAQECKVSAMPTFHFMKNGEKVDELVGADPGQLEKLIQKHR